MRRKWVAPVIAIMIILGLGVSVVRMWRYSPYKMKRDLVGNPEIVLSLRDVEISGRNNGKKFWSFNAETVDVTRGRIVTTVAGIHDGRLYDEGKLVAKVAAGRAVYNTINGNVEVSKGVKVQSTTGFRASADRAIWTRGTSQLVCPGKVVFASGDSNLVGKNLVGDVRQNEVRLEHGRMLVDVEDLTKIEGDEDI